MKLLITESQLEIIISHIKETTPKKVVLEEGWKDIVLGTAMLMGISLSGINAKIAKNALNSVESIKKLEKVISGPELEKVATTLESGGLSDAMIKIQNKALKIKQNLEDAAKKQGLSLNVHVYVDEKTDQG